MSIQSTCSATGCGKAFTTIPSKVKVGKGKSCSKACYYANGAGPKSGVGRMTYSREGCDVTVTGRSWQKHRYCSLACSSLAQVTGETRACERCRAPSWAIPRDIRRGKARWCSPACATTRPQGHTDEQFWASFWARVEKSTDPEGCWLWAGPKGWARDTEYGLVWVGPRKTRRRVRAHIVTLLYALGRPLLPKHQGNHTCDTPLCVRVGVGHVYEGTHAQNMRDKAEHGRAAGAPGSRNGNSKLTEEQVREIKLALAEGYPQEMLADEYGVNFRTISAIANGHTWKHIIVATHDR